MSAAAYTPSGDAAVPYSADDVANNPFFDPSFAQAPAPQPAAAQTPMPETDPAYRPDGGASGSGYSAHESIYDDIPANFAAPQQSLRYGNLQSTQGAPAGASGAASGYQEPTRAANGEGIYEELPALRGPGNSAAAPQSQSSQRQGDMQGEFTEDDMASEEPYQHGALMTGQLPDDFLRLTERVPISRTQPAYADPDPAFATHMHMQPRRQGILRISVVQAKLAKNYGMLRMDPFCRFISGPFHKTTSVCIKGGKEPRWNQLLDVPLLVGTVNVRVEMFDMGTFSDSMIAWGDIDVSNLEPGVTTEKWYHLSGKQGEDKEGVILLRILLQPTAYPPMSYSVPFAPTYPGQQTIVYQVPDGSLFPGDGDMLVAYPGATTIVNGPPLAYPSQRVIVQQRQPMPIQPPMQQQQQQQHQQQLQQQPPIQRQLRAEDVRQLREMFPDMEEEVIKSVLVANRGDVTASLNALLSMASAS